MFCDGHVSELKGVGIGDSGRTSGALLWAVGAPPCFVGASASVHGSVPGTEVV